MSTKDILYDVPVSNHGARVRIILKEKGLENYVEIKSPQDIGHQISVFFLNSKQFFSLLCLCQILQVA